jgi:hypothetical protein
MFCQKLAGDFRNKLVRPRRFSFFNIKGNAMNLVNKLIWLLSVIGAVALGVAGMWLFGPKPKPILPTQAPMIALEKMGHLVSVKLNYADIIELTEKRAQDIPWTQWELRLGGTKVLLVARGDCTVATDLRAATYEKVDLQARTLSLSLPAPKPIVVRVNHDTREKGGSYFYAINNQGLEPIIPDSSNRIRAIDHALERAQQEVERACKQPDVTASAKKNAQDVLRATFQAVGWDVQFIWR